MTVGTQNTIEDFSQSQHDQIKFIDVAGVQSFNNLVITQSGTDTVITAGEDQVTLHNFMGSLTEKDFLLGYVLTMPIASSELDMIYVLWSVPLCRMSVLAVRIQRDRPNHDASCRLSADRRMLGAAFVDAPRAAAFSLRQRRK
jgi:hypothetical protein